MVDYGVIAGAQPSTKVKPAHNWQKVEREPVGFPSPSPGFWSFIAGALFGVLLGPELWAAGKKGRERLREVIEKKL